jgi:hypothetical protein
LEIVPKCVFVSFIFISFSEQKQAKPVSLRHSEASRLAYLQVLLVKPDWPYPELCISPMLGIFNLQYFARDP